MARSRSVLLLPLFLGAGVALFACGSSSPTSAYVPPPRQKPVLAESLSPRTCSSTTMGGGLLAVCDPLLLERAWKDHTLNKPGTLEVSIPGRKLRVGSNPGLVQVLPADGIGTLSAPATVTLRGKASVGSSLYIHAESFKPEHLADGEALFHHLGLEHGGTATVDVTLERGEVAFALRRPDGTVLKPLRSSHREGPGPMAELPPLPAHYADVPRQGVTTYIAAINAHDGTTICQLWTAAIRARFSSERIPCWAAVAGLIEYGGENSPIFQRIELVRIGKLYSRVRFGVSFTAVPLTLRSHYLRSSDSNVPETRERSGILWLQQNKDGWRIAKDAAVFSTRRSEDASTPPDPYAALHAKQAAQREARADRAVRRGSLVSLGHGLTCPRPTLTLTDPAYDVKSTPGAQVRRARRVGEGADVTAASLSLRDRNACFSIGFRGEPLAGRERIFITLLYSPADPSRRRSVAFLIDNGYTKADGLHAGIAAAAGDVLTPDHARLGVDSHTLMASFALPASFPTLTPKQLSRFGWTISSDQFAPQSHLSVFDKAEAGLTEAKIVAASVKSEKAREARAKAAQQAQIELAWAPALVHFNGGAVRCSGKQVAVEDAAGDVALQQPGAKTIPARSPLRALTDLSGATVAVSGRHVCVMVAFATQPFGRRQHRFALDLGMTFAYKTPTPPYLRTIGFGIETNKHLQNGLTYAGIPANGGSTHPDPAHLHVALHGNTLTVVFDLEAGFPALHTSQLKNLSWAMGFFGTDLAPYHAPLFGPLGSHDQIPDNPDTTGNDVSPAVRQSDGKIIKPY